MATINVTLKADREFLEDHERVAVEFGGLATQVAALTSLLAQATADRDALAVKARRGLVRYKPALGGALEATLTDIALERDGTGDIVAVHTNADAAAFRAGA